MINSRSHLQAGIFGRVVRTPRIWSPTCICRPPFPRTKTASNARKPLHGMTVVPGAPSGASRSRDKLSSMMQASAQTSARGGITFRRTGDRLPKLVFQCWGFSRTAEGAVPDRFRFGLQRAAGLRSCDAELVFSMDLGMCLNRFTTDSKLAPSRPRVVARPGGPDPQ